MRLQAASKNQDTRLGKDYAELTKGTLVGNRYI